MRKVKEPCFRIDSGGSHLMESSRTRWRRIALAAVIVLGVGFSWNGPIAEADEEVRTMAEYADGSITVGAERTATENGQAGSDEAGESTSASSADPQGCFDVFGVEVPCWSDYGTWTPQFQTYCMIWDPPEGHVIRQHHLDRNGNFYGYVIRCIFPDGTNEATFSVWSPRPN